MAMDVTGKVLPGSAATPRSFMAWQGEHDETVTRGWPPFGKFLFAGEMS
jgi:hypothetical protein